MARSCPFEGWLAPDMIPHVMSASQEANVSDFMRALVGCLECHRASWLVKASCRNWFPLPNVLAIE
jgi:hypothetical protein